MAVPTIPSLSGADAFVQAGPGGISAGFSIAFDQCNARPVMVYVTQQKNPPAGGGGDWPRVEPPPPGFPIPPPPTEPPPIARPPDPQGQKGGQIWRLFDPLAAIEKIPVWKDWGEEKTYPNGHWKPRYRQVQRPGRREPDTVIPPPYITPALYSLRDRVDKSYFKFDEPGTNVVGLSNYPRAFNDPSDVNGDIDAVAAILSAPARNQDGSEVPLSQTPFTRKLVVFGHADMCAAFWYNFWLTERRIKAFGVVLGSHPRGAELRNALLTSTGPGMGFIPCSDFNPDSGPTPHEKAAEEQTQTRTINGMRCLPGFHPHPGSGPIGNPDNRRIELLVLPECQSSCGKSYLDELINGNSANGTRGIRGEIQDECGVTWPAGQLFPCPRGWTPDPPADARFGSPALQTTADQDIGICKRLSTGAGPGLHNDGQSGSGYRQCRFYQKLKQKLGLTGTAQRIDSEVPLTADYCRPAGPPPGPTVIPGRETPPTTEQVFDGYDWIEDPPIKQVVGEYHPPKGEHFSYYMDNMVKEGVDARDVFPPTVPVAPNQRDNPDSFNLIKASSVRIVKMDVGLWADERTLDVDRKGGIRRTPRRSFGLVEGPFVFLCYFQTPETRGFVRPCSEGFDSDLTPLCAQLDQAVRDLGPDFKILIMAKAVAEDGPNRNRLKVFFPDMHLPRRFDDRDPVYASDKCIRRVQSVKSMVLHQLKRDYRLPAAMTPWLTTLDRRMCRDFFESGAPRLKLPHLYTEGGPRLEMRTTSTDSFMDVVRTGAEAVRNAYVALMQAGFRLFAFTQDDYRRMVRMYPENFPEKGYGRTKDVLFNWFYGFTTDRNAPPPAESPLERTAKNLVPEIVQNVLDTHAGTSLGLGSGTPPAQESYDAVDPGPARDLLRFLRVIRNRQRDTANPTPIDVFNLGDLYEIWANRRFLFEDFEICNDPLDPGGQIAGLGSTFDGPTSTDNFVGDAGGAVGGLFGDAGKQVGKAIGGNLGALAGDAIKLMVRSLLGGINATDRDLWWRRETNDPARDPAMDPDLAMLPYEEAYTLTRFDPQLHLPRFSAPPAGPGVIGGGMTNPSGNGQISLDGIEYTKHQLGTPRPDGTWGPFPATNDRGRGYLTREVARRIAQVDAFEAPVRQDPAGNREDLALLGSNVVGRGAEQMGRWNKAVADAFRDVRATFLYGNHDCFRGVPRRGGVNSARPFHSEPGLWVEHGHRFDDSNVDGQPFGSFVTNVAYEIQEASFAEGLADEFALHREQSCFQPGIVQWFLLVEFGGNAFLRRHQRQNDNVPAVFPFRISVNGHTHTPDLVVANVIFKDREALELKLFGKSIKVADIFNAGCAALKIALLYKKLKEWYDKWTERAGWDKWWEDIKGNTINWGVDFAGLAGCIDKAMDFIKKQGENARDRLRNEWEASRDSFKNMVDQNARNLGLPPP